MPTFPKYFLKIFLKSFNNRFHCISNLEKQKQQKKSLFLTGSIFNIQHFWGKRVNRVLIID